MASTQEASDTRDGLRHLDGPEIQAILEEHERWLETSGADGRRADLANTVLQNADLTGRNLSQSVMTNARLLCAKAQHCDFSRANMRGVVLRDVDLTCANLAHADITAMKISNVVFDRCVIDETKGVDALLKPGADLRQLRGMLTSSLQGRDLSGVQLPEQLQHFANLDQVVEICKISQTILLAVIGASSYSLLTVASTKDVSFVVSTATSPLPIIQTPVSTVGFYLAAPLLLLMMGVYFHLYLQRLWDALGKLPAIFPDGATLDEAAYPWMLTTFATAHLPGLKKRRSAFWQLQLAMTVLVSWFLVPFTIGIIWLRYLACHDYEGTAIQILVLAITISGMRVFYGRAKGAVGALHPDGSAPHRWSGVVSFIAGCVAAAACLAAMSFAAIEGDPVSDYEPWSWRATSLVPETLDRVGLSPYLKIVNARLVNAESLPPMPFGLLPQSLPSPINAQNAPPGGPGGSPFPTAPAASPSDKPGTVPPGPMPVAALPQPIPVFQGALPQPPVGISLVGRDFRNARAIGVSLQYSDLSEARFDGADLSNANLFAANLRDTHLESASLDRAYAVSAQLVHADLRKADLNGANLLGADLELARMDEAKLECHIIENMPPTCTNLVGARIERASMEDAVLYGADLQNADLRAAGLRHAKIGGANVTGALFGCVPVPSKEERHCTDLRGADLRGAVGLGRNQLESACGDDTTQVPDGISRPRKCGPSELGIVGWQPSR